MKKIIALVALILPFCTIAQKIDIEDSLIKVDGVPYAKVVKEGKGFFSEKIITFYELGGKPAIVVKYFTITNVKSAVDNTNSNGEVRYAEINFLKSKQKGQLQNLPMKLEKVVSKIVKAHIFKDGKVDDEAVDNFVLINPAEYSKQQKVIVVPSN